MTIRDCVVVAIEGTHASGKTTLVHALIANYRARGVLVEFVGEPARSSPFIEEIVIHGRGEFDLVTEVDLFAAQLSAQLRASRHQKLLICDKTIANVLAYARLVLDAPSGSHESSMLTAMTAFCRAWVHTYDAVYYCADHYDGIADPLRTKVDALDLQDATATAVRDTCALIGLSLTEVPPGLSVADRVHWTAARIDQLLTT